MVKSHKKKGKQLRRTFKGGFWWSSAAAPPPPPPQEEGDEEEQEEEEGDEENPPVKAEASYANENENQVPVAIPINTGMRTKLNNGAKKARILLYNTTVGEIKNGEVPILGTAWRKFYNRVWKGDRNKLTFDPKFGYLTHDPTPVATPVPGGKKTRKNKKKRTRKTNKK